MAEVGNVDQVTSLIGFRVSDGLRLDEARDLFLNALVGAKSAATVRWYGGQCDQEGAWAGGQIQLLLDHFGPSTLVEAITLDHLNRWRAVLLHKKNKKTGKPLSVWSADAAIRAAKTFFSWLKGKHHTAVNPAEDLERPTLPKRARRGVSDGDAMAMLAAAEDSSIRDRALLAVFDATGCRLGGVADLRLADVDLKRRRLLVREKGDKERTVFLTPTARDYLRAWLEVRPSKPGVNHVFVSEQEGKRLGTAMTSSGLAQVLKRLKKAHHISGRVSPHQWRHRRLRILTSSGTPLGIVADIAGHADSRTTHQFYGAFAVDELQEIYDRFSGGEESN
ncbi:MAG: tyrosine-type recombinase/integrase [Anaerolineales bacterium]|nr:tyrosine-type recombinase/integrase [Anaerolineales bacterium]